MDASSGRATLVMTASAISVCASDMTVGPSGHCQTVIRGEENTSVRSGEMATAWSPAGCPYTTLSSMVVFCIVCGAGHHCYCYGQHCYCYGQHCYAGEEQQAQRHPGTDDKGNLAGSGSTKRLQDAVRCYPVSTVV